MPAAVSIQVKGGEVVAAVAGARRWTQTVPQMTARMANQAAPLLLRSARSAVPVKTGKTRDSMAVQTQRVGDRVRLVLNYSLIGKFLITGTRPHLILPVRARVLHFFWAGHGETFARVVHHPGTKPNDWRVPMRRALRPLLVQSGMGEVKTYVRNLAREMKG